MSVTLNKKLLALAIGAAFIPAAAFAAGGSGNSTDLSTLTGAGMVTTTIENTGDVQVIVDTDSAGAGQFIVTDINGSDTAVNTITSDAQSTTITATDAAGTTTTGQVVVGNGVQITGNTSVTGTLDVTGASTINNTLAVDSNGATGDVADTTGLLNVTNGGSVNLGVSSGGNFAATGTQAQVSAGSASYTAYEAAQVVGTDYTLLNGNAASRALVTGASVTNIISGNTLIDGNVYINGSLTYSSNTSASTTVTGTNTAGSMNIVNSGQTGAVVDANGKITTGGTTSQATASLTVTNTLGNTHGIVVQESKTTVSGGNNSTSLTLDDSGARFSNSATGAPTRVTGVADGTSDFDAVNYRQLKNVAAGVAGVAAMANIPQLDQGKTIAVGVGVGSFQSENALALGATFRVNNNAVIRASVATQGSRSNKTTVYGLGAGLSW